MTTPIALVTGGNRGLGRSAVLALARRGVDIVLTYRGNAAEAAAVVAEIEALGRRAAALPLDLSDPAGVPAFTPALRKVLRERFSSDRIRYLLNNAGNGVNASIADTTGAQIDAMVHIHFKGPFLLTQALLPLLEDNGRILNVSSGLTRFSMAGYAAYASMKGAIEVFTRYLAAELGARGISVNVIAPGAIETDFGGGRVRDDAAINSHIASATAKGRVGLPDDIGPAMAMLLAGDTHWITGQRVEASGGMLL
ncbi:MAG: SDR family oxidoreductase [Pseudomonadota bacterium]|nr:SDR family oxidoreductase [Pseudomonadota bacterium]